MCAAALVLLPALRAQEPEINARDMFYSAADLVGKRPVRSLPAKTSGNPVRKTTVANHPPVNTVAVASAPLGVRYSILKRTAGKKFAEVAPDAAFHAGDMLRLSVTANQRGYLYIIQKGSSGNWTPLFPDPKINGGVNLIEPGKVYEIPNGAGEAFEIDRQPGEEKIFLLLTRQPESDLDGTILALRKSDAPAAGTVVLAQAGINDGLIDQIRNQVLARDLVFTKIDDSADAEKAVYVVNKTASQDPPRIVVDVVLNHR